MPDPVPDLEVVGSTAVGFVDVQGGDVEDDLLAVRGRDAPLALLPLGGRGGVRVLRGSEGPRIFLVGSAAFWSTNNGGGE